MRLPRALVFGVCCAVAGAADAWNSRGHFDVARAAALAQLGDVPEYFRWGADAIGHSAIDPDVMKEREAPLLRHRESPEHYLDLELLDPVGGQSALDGLRYDYLGKLVEAGLDPTRVGLVPWAVAENAERLALVFAEHRCWPADPHVQAKTLVYAGILAHYASDMVQPLHTTIHYNGRATAEGNSPGTGIHGHVDGLFEAPGFEPPTGPATLELFEELWPAVRAEFLASFARVDEVYELEVALAALDEGGMWSSELRTFARDRYRRSVDFVGSLYRWAWHRSSEIELAGWMRRIGPGGELVACREDIAAPVSSHD